MRREAFPWRHLRIFRIVQTKRGADDVLEFFRVPYSDPKQKRASAREAEGGGEGWGGGGHLPVLIIDKK